MSGHVQARGKNSWRIKFEGGRDAAGKRLTKYVTFRGTKKQAHAELTRLLASLNAGTFIEPATITVAEYMRGWISAAETLSLSPKTAERYRQLIECQIVPRLGYHQLQKLKAAHINAWHALLIKEGKMDGQPLAPRTVGHAHRVLHKALADAVRHELLSRNPAALVAAPRVANREMAILTADQVVTVLHAMRETVIFPQIMLLLSTGMRRGEIAGLQWGDIDLDKAKLRIARSIEKTKSLGLRVKAPKTQHGRRVITLPLVAVEALRDHRKAQLELRLRLRAGRLPDDAYVFGTVEGGLRDPDRLTQDWRRFAEARRLPRVTLQGLRHSHASALIASGTDVVKVSRRLGHGSPVITMAVYAHLFDPGDEGAAQVIDSVLTGEHKRQ